MKNHFTCCYFVLFFILCINTFCNKENNSIQTMSHQPWHQKIQFDLSGIRADGLTGPADGLVSVSYEFCIPGKQELLAEVLAIDSTIQYSFGSGGRIGCGESDYLCIGDTHKPNWREILQQIATLEYVERIQRAWFE